ncbi:MULTISPECIES: hypothetical protein [unclassified Nocardioides]|uniref:hypothetical protein n=1 Tax=unclassified Nocardioides TaxID=2615069 RepID=UPI0009F01AF1|nr:MULTISPECIES: hypothetical protein [unclassified Nocardioides]GAW49904.1 uncharacterized protein PD653B2_2233 [Nocardioides sp. PD653-B2]GAW56003.1 uncharacterized protein PD653_3431 [Nocardioides sp. PD653]
MTIFKRDRSPIRTERGERLLATAEADGVHLGGTRDALYVVRPIGGGAFELADTTRIPWEEVEAADWDLETSTLRVTEVGTWGETRPEHTFVIEEPGRLLELVRERVTASIVLQRHVAIAGRRGVRVIARRAPRGDRPVVWLYEYDDGVDPADPVVQAAATEALEAAQAEVGLL